MADETEHHTPDHSADEKGELPSGPVSGGSMDAPTSPESTHPDLRPGRHLLGPHVVGQRVVVRRLVPGETGPTGGPAFTDTLGICRSWSSQECVLEKADGATVTVPLALIVSGKPVPPRPSVHARVPVGRAEALVSDLWPEVTSTPIGAWTARNSPARGGRLLKRANSALALDIPGTDAATGTELDATAAAAAVLAHYRALGQEPLVATEPGSAADVALHGLGWQVLPHGASRFLVAPLSRVARLLPATDVEMLATEGDRDLSSEVRHGQEVVAGGRAVLTGDGSWVGLEALQVAPEHRRTGLARAVLADLLDWAASRGATTVWLHVEVGNEAAEALYEALGFTEHHRMHYLVGPASRD